MRTPNDGKKYWYIDFSMDNNIDWRFAQGYIFDVEMFEIGNFFSTKKEAQESLKKIKELLLSLKK